MEQKGDNKTPATKLRGLPQGLGKSRSDFYKIVGKGKGQNLPTLLQFKLGELEKEVEEGGDITEILAKFQNIYLKQAKSSRSSENDITRARTMAPTRTGGDPSQRKHQKKLDFPSKARDKPPSATGKGEDPCTKKKENADSRGKKAHQHGTPLHGSMEEEEDEVSMDMGTEKEDAGAEGVSPLPATALSDQFQAAASAEEFKILQGLKISTSGTFAALEDGSNPRLGPGKDLYVGKKFLKRLIISHGGHYVDQVTKETKLLIIREYPGKSKVEKARSLGIHLGTYELVQELLVGEIFWAGLLAQLAPAIAVYSQGYGPPSILCKSGEPGLDKVTTFSRNFKEPGLDKATSSSTIRFSTTKQVMRKKPTDTPECPSANLVPGSEIIARRGILNLANLRKGKEPKFISIIHVIVWVPSGNVKELVMNLLFMELDTLRAKDKTVCFVHPTNSSAPSSIDKKFMECHYYRK